MIFYKKVILPILPNPKLWYLLDQKDERVGPLTESQLRWSLEYGIIKGNTPISPQNERFFTSADLFPDIFPVIRYERSSFVPDPKVWYYIDVDGNQQGPVSLIVFEKLYKDKILSSETFSYSIWDVNPRWSLPDFYIHPFSPSECKQRTIPRSVKGLLQYILFREVYQPPDFYPEPMRKVLIEIRTVFLWSAAFMFFFVLVSMLSRDREETFSYFVMSFIMDWIVISLIFPGFGLFIIVLDRYRYEIHNWLICLFPLGFLLILLLWGSLGGLMLYSFAYAIIFIILQVIWTMYKKFI